MQSLLVLSLIAGFGYSGENSLGCDPPPTVEYSCSPITDGSSGCVGGPVWRSHYTGPAHYEDPDKVFPVGCVATLPECPCCYPTPRHVTCLEMTPEPNDAGIATEIGWSGEAL